MIAFVIDSSVSAQQRAALEAALGMATNGTPTSVYAFPVDASFGSDLDPAIFDFVEDEPYRGRALAAPPGLRGGPIGYRDPKPENMRGHARPAWPAVVRSFA